MMKYTVKYSTLFKKSFLTDTGTHSDIFGQSESPDCGHFLQIQNLISSKFTYFRPGNLSWRISEIW